jgi:hypothetical protein
MAAMRTVASKKGLATSQVKRGWDMFIKTSRLGEPMASARKKLNLPEAAKSGAEDFKKLVKIYQEKKRSGVKRNEP